MKNSVLVKITEKRVQTIKMDELKNAIAGITWDELKDLQADFHRSCEAEEYHDRIGNTIARVVYRTMQEKVKPENACEKTIAAIKETVVGLHKELSEISNPEQRAKKRKGILCAEEIIEDLQGEL